MSPWFSVADIPPPTGEQLLVAWNPCHLLRPIGVARLETGYGWVCSGDRMPAPLYWMRLPPLPSDLREAA